MTMTLTKDREAIVKRADGSTVARVRETAKGTETDVAVGSRTVTVKDNDDGSVTVDIGWTRVFEAGPDEQGWNTLHNDSL